MPSIRSCNRARTSSESGFALLWAIGLAVLYFMLIELMLIDSARELKEAQRFRSRIVAMVLAENAAELAAERITDNVLNNPPMSEDWQGRIYGQMNRNEQSDEFTIVGTGETAGTHRSKAVVEVEGRVDRTDTTSPPKIHIDFTRHKP